MYNPIQDQDIESLLNKLFPFLSQSTFAVFKDPRHNKDPSHNWIVTFEEKKMATAFCQTLFSTFQVKSTTNPDKQKEAQSISDEQGGLFFGVFLTPNDVQTLKKQVSKTESPPLETKKETPVVGDSGKSSIHSFHQPSSSPVVTQTESKKERWSTEERRQIQQLDDYQNQLQTELQAIYQLIEQSPGDTALERQEWELTYVNTLVNALLTQSQNPQLEHLFLNQILKNIYDNSELLSHSTMTIYSKGQNALAKTVMTYIKTIEKTEAVVSKPTTKPPGP